MRSYLLGLYEKSMPGTLSWKEKLEAAKAAGFDYVEMSIDETDAKLARLDMSEAEIEEIKAAMKETGSPAAKRPSSFPAMTRQQAKKSPSRRESVCLTANCAW